MLRSQPISLPVGIVVLLSPTMQEIEVQALVASETSVKLVPNNHAVCSAVATLNREQLKWKEAGIEFSSPSGTQVKALHVVVTAPYHFFSYQKQIVAEMTKKVMIKM